MTEPNDFDLTSSEGSILVEIDAELRQTPPPDDEDPDPAEPE